MNKTEDELIEIAAGLNANYRGVTSALDDELLDMGFLVGTAEMVLALVGLGDGESYDQRSGEITLKIDLAAAAQVV